MADPQASSSKPIQRSKFTYTKPTEERPFSSSAAKRSSVMALGRIDHLQHYFAREARRVHKESNNSTLPIYAGQEAVVELPEEDEEEELPATPKAEPRKQVYEWQETEERIGWKEMRETVWSEIDQVCQRWGIVEHLKRDCSATASPEMSSSHSQDSSAPSSKPAILDLITLTTTAIRSVQHFVISLPTELGSLSLDSPLTTRHTSHLNVSTASRPRTSLNALPVPSSSSMRRDPSNPSNELRKACLDVLGTLKEMDLDYRLEDEGEDKVYREISLAELGKEKEAVRQWIQVVDRTLFATMRKSGVNEEDTLDESPDWAKSEEFDDTLVQAHHLIRSHLPTELLSHLEAPPLFLESLSNGQLLCTSFNAVLRQSTRPWGFIPSDAVHVFSDTTSARRQVSEEGSARVGLTFRRLENLRVWVAAIKLRYGIHLGRERVNSKDDAASEFDLKAIARKDVGWEKMLQVAVKRWTVAVVQEKREEMGL